MDDFKARWQYAKTPTFSWCSARYRGAGKISNEIIQVKLAELWTQSKPT